MSVAQNARRSRAIAAAVALCAFAASVASAQDARTSEVQTAARQWLKLVDAGDYRASWKAAGTKFQNNLPENAWVEAATKARAPFGKVDQRAVLKTSFATSFPGAPDGDYAHLIFRSSFEHKTDARETVTLERESNGWRVVGYFIRGPG